MKKVLPSLFLALLACTSCSSDIKSALKKPAPDEYTVISNPPLSVPPNFDLQNPDDSRSNSQQLQSSEGKPGIGLDKEDKQFMQHLGAHKHKGHVKKMIDEDHAHSKKQMQSKGFIRKAVANLNSEGEDEFVDPVKESQRIQENQEADRAINEGEVPTREGRTTLQRLFN
jgi:hypothetical protein